MDQNRKLEYRQLIKYTMNYGLILGLFWFVKYIFLIASDLFISFIYLYNLLSIVTLLLYYVLLNRYRDKALGGYISYRRCILFSVLLFFSAACIEAVIIYIHVAIIDPSYIGTVQKTGIEVIKNLFKFIWQYFMDVFFGSGQSVVQIVKGESPVPNNALYVLNSISVDTAIGFTLSLLYGIFARRTR